LPYKRQNKGIFGKVKVKYLICLSASLEVIPPKSLYPLTYLRGQRKSWPNKNSSSTTIVWSHFR